MTDSAEPTPDPNEEEQSLPESETTLEASEADLWDLDEEEAVAETLELPLEETVVPVDPEPEDEEAVEEAGNAEKVTRLVTKSGKLPASTRRQTEAEDPFSQLEEDEEPAADEVAPAEDVEEELPVTVAPQPAPEPAASAASDDDEPEAATPQEPAAPIAAKAPLHPGEKAALGIFALLLVLGIVWVFRALSEAIPTTHAGATEVEYPVTGTHAGVSGVETFWRRPITSGANPDRFRQGASLLPVARISLSSDNTRAGALRVFFRNDRGEIVGDPSTLPFFGGRFTINNERTIDVAGTDGFHDEAVHAAYRAGQEEPWTLDIHEAASADAPAAEFSKLLEIPLSPERR